MPKIVWPKVTVLVVTYDRPLEIRCTIAALKRHLTYEGKLRYFLCDDGSPSGYLAQIMKEFPECNFAFSITPRRGWGVNVNVGMARSAPTDYYFLVEDDYVAQREINLSQGVALMEAIPTIGLVRYDALAGHKLNLCLRGIKTPTGHVEYLSINQDSPDLNIYSNRPHLKHTRFHKDYGLYVEDRALGATEEEFAHRVKDRKGPGLTIASLATGIPSAFDHIGHSRQGTAADTLIGATHA